MSILHRFESELPLLELVKLWRLPETTPDQLLDVLMRAALAGEFDRANRGQPGILFEVAELIPVTGADLKRELGHVGWDKRTLAGHLWIAKAAVLAFVAVRPEVPLPSFWAPEEAPSMPAPSARRASEAEVRAWVERPDIAALNVVDQLREARKHFGARVTARLLKTVRGMRTPGRKSRQGRFDCLD